MPLASHPTHPPRQASLGRGILRPHFMRLTTPIRAFGPLLLGVGAAVLARVLVDLEPLSELRANLVGPAKLALIWILPVLAGALVSATRTLWIEVGAGGVRVRRLLGSTRLYTPGELVSWGFEHGPGTYSTLPPAQATPAVRFVLQTADGWGFEKTISAQTALRLSTLLLRGRSQF